MCSPAQDEECAMPPTYSLCRRKPNAEELTSEARDALALRAAAPKIAGRDNGSDRVSIATPRIRYSREVHASMVLGRHKMFTVLPFGVSDEALPVEE